MQLFFLGPRWALWKKRVTDTQTLDSGSGGTHWRRERAAALPVHIWTHADVLLLALDRKSSEIAYQEPTTAACNDMPLYSTHCSSSAQ